MDFWFKMLRLDLGNCASCFGREHIFEKMAKKSGRKVKNAAKNRYMATLMLTCTGLVGRKSENVKILSASVRPKWASK